MLETIAKYDNPQLKGLQRKDLIANSRPTFVKKAKYLMLLSR